ncbi:hypothetical protein [Falsirhodobacter sp. 20TX0035]|uniref:hypothetical protein n=1 Tax=Falsirhodobacter sp. 20TX0035 TaxID=3022019 RepID=UPI00232FA578|nr:hypothetical protein [Falsirhodobacter sp. 20TX0035]MDB6453560.1 hypothetical protein [Falsirhodobacter sp. 20TX0035]
MADLHKKGPKRPTKVIYIIAAIVAVIIVTIFVGMNISHKNEMEDAQQQGETPINAPAANPTR